jgi:ribosome-interacting GTPase 1
MSSTAQQKIDDIHFEISRTQKNKATEYHIGRLKAKLAMLHAAKIKAEAQEGHKSAGTGFAVRRTGDASIALVGFPSAGKSSLLSTITKTKSMTAAYEFSTLTCIPGVLEYKDTTIQILDLPGIIEGAAVGKGRGREVISVARSSDMVLMVIDSSRTAESFGRVNLHLTKPVTCGIEMQRRLLTKELYECGIRLNRSPPDISIKVTKAGGVRLNSMVELHYVDVNIIKDILNMHKIHNADVLFRGDYTVDDFIDVVMNNRKFLPCVYAINKIDTITIDRVNFYAHCKHTVVMSCQHKLNMEYLLQALWDHLDFIRIYTKPIGEKPSFHEPIILHRGNTVQHVCLFIHRDFVTKFKYAYVWGKSAKFQMAQRVGLKHVLADEDVVALYVQR